MSDNTAGDLPTPGKTRSRDIDVFVSYARSDNRPFSPGAEGWVSAVVRLLEEAAIEAESPMRIFFDTQEIESGDYWEQKLRDALRSSRVLVAFVSPAYFRSSFCRWEWEQHLLRRERLAAEYGGDGDVESPAQTILFVEVPEELGPTRAAAMRPRANGAAPCSPRTSRISWSGMPRAHPRWSPTVCGSGSPRSRPR